ncbi:PepSY domain-containing protein [Paenibacillus frigoriresistens]|uniref:PepSY-associated TM helix domain-containing protein n=1 Tax=Paenibacillus alginolyticus TaxID=59839 RepID=UPI001565CA3E|nr:PepSY-associated TM helix domain-containing protein [Paenibacillus frigoriresistens]NRF90410.1 PepSY domain-containing protein [Paenibacillus frigoriresistens]
MRKLFLQIHLWISLVLGLFIVVICTTGSLLVIENDVEKWMHPQLYQPTPGHALLQDVQHSAEQAFPGFKMDRIELSTEDGLYQARLSKDVNGKVSTQNVYIDPGSAHVLGPVGPNRNVFFTKVLQIHRYLLAQDVLGKANASIVVGFMGIGLIIILVTGAYLWWPGLRKFALGFRIIRNKGKLTLNLGLHKTVGIITIPFLLVFALTGTAYQLDKYVLGWFGLSTKIEAAASWSKTTKMNGSPLSLDTIVQKAQVRFPNHKLVRVQLPTKPDQTYQLAMKEGYSPSGTSNVTVYEDPYTGEILGITNPNAPMAFYSAWKRGLHFAAWGGTPVRIGSFLMGMMPLFLMITGLVIWQFKAKARRRSRSSSRIKESPPTTKVPSMSPAE